jgi:redox-sensitive bicupin YhaK (pirin superfamily)
LPPTRGSGLVTLAVRDHIGRKSQPESSPMIERRPFAGLGGDKLDWLDTRHHFSFANYRDPARMHWGALRVWNDDEIAPGTGFPPHPHADMEIVTYVRQGAVSHEDSLGNKGRTEAGDVQVMSAGTGIRHAEYNRESEPTSLFQIWIIPTRNGGSPSWGTRPFPAAGRSGRLIALASGDAADAEALPIRADARVLGARLKRGQTIEYALQPGRHAYLVPASGALTVNGVRIDERDGAAIRDEDVLRVAALADTELVLVDTA